MKLRSRVVISSVLSLVLGATLVHGAALASPEDFSAVAEIVGDGTQTCAADADSVTAAIELRSRLGLEASSELVRSTFGSSDYICTPFGVPLTAAEASAFLAHINTQAELSDSAERFAGDPTFGGAFLDGIRLVIVSTDGRLGEDLVTRRGSVERRAAPFTLSELEAVAEEITEGAKNASPDQLGADITYVSVNPRTNTVDVGVAANVTAAREMLADKHGDRVTLALVPREEGEHFCTKNDCGTKGGLTITKSGLTCTSGFVVQARKNAGAWAHYMLTAGHCIHNSGGIDSTANWKNGAGTITWGRSKGHSFWESECEGWTRCWDNDLGLHSFGSNVPATKNHYFIGTNSWVSITGSKTKANQLIGQTVWRHGNTSGLGSATITAKPNFYAYSCFPYTCKHFNTVKVDHGSAPGDSGSGYYRAYTSGGVTTRYAYGVLSVGPTGGSETHYYAWNEYFDDYSNDVCDVWEVKPCTSGACTLP